MYCVDKKYSTCIDRTVLVDCTGMYRANKPKKDSSLRLQYTGLTTVLYAAWSLVHSYSNTVATSK